MFKSSALAVAALAVALASPKSAKADDSAPIVQWDPSSPAGALIAGSGCKMNVDAWAFANGSDLTIVFTNLGIDLSDDIRLADRKACAVRIPVTIPSGTYIDSLSQSLYYGVQKSAGTSVALAARSTFMGFPVSPFTVSLPRGLEIDDEYTSQSRDDHYGPDSSWGHGFCSTSRPTSGLYQANLAVSGMRDDAWEYAQAFIYGTDMRYELSATLSYC
jgi:hypothetical protein